MSVLSVLSGVANAAGKAYQGYGVDQQDKVANILAQEKANQEAQRNAVLNTLSMREINTPRLGDADYAGAMANVAGATANATEQVDVKKATDIAAGTAPIEQRTHEVERLFDNAHAPADKPSFVFPTVTGADGTPVVARGNTKTGEIEPTTIGKPVGSGGGSQSGLTLQTMARMGMSAADLRKAIGEMAAYENDPANLAKLTPGKQAIGATAEVVPNQEAHGLAGVLSNGAGAFLAGAAQQHIAQSDPAYRQYLYNKQRVGTAFTELLPRPNQQLLGIEKGLSGVDVGWSPALLQDVQARRQAGLDMLEKILSGTTLGAGHSTGASAAPHGAHPIYDKYGLTPPTP